MRPFPFKPILLNKSASQKDSSERASHAIDNLSKSSNHSVHYGRYDDARSKRKNMAPKLLGYKPPNTSLLSHINEIKELSQMERKASDKKFPAKTIKRD